MRKAYALALVVTLSAFLGIASTIMLERQAAQRLSLVRQVDRYQELHGTRGIQEVLSMWMRSITTESLAAQVKENPHVLDIELADGTELRVFLRDGQGTLRSDPSGLSRQARIDLVAMLALARQDPALAGRPELFRAVGPLAVSALDAPPELLRIVALHLAGDERKADAIVSAILDKRADGEFTPADVGECCTAGDLSREARANFGRLFAAEPSLWRVEVQLREPHAWNPEGDLRAAYEGLFELDRSFARLGRASGMESMRQSSPFIEWRRKE